MELLLPEVRSFRQFSATWRNIMKPLLSADDFADTLLLGFGYSLGNGESIRFWHHEWIPGVILRFSFPRIYALSVNKEGKVKDFGMLVCPLFEDKIIWKANSSGVYSSKSFCEEHCARGQGADQDWSIIWNGLSPPKVELFCWKLLKNRVAVKANLAARNALQGQCLSCALCERVEETVEHLFFQCNFSWCIWNSWSALWGISWAANKGGWDFFEEWVNLCPVNNCQKLWIMAFGAICWMIWLCRNDNVFCRKGVKLEMAIDLVRFRIATWFKAKWPQECVNVVDILRDPRVCLPQVKNHRIRLGMYWEKPPMGFVKFNVDGSSLGNPGPSGIGGILRDYLGRELIKFSKFVGFSDSNMVELMAIREAVVLFVTTQWVVDESLILECDSRNAVSWVANPDTAPWRMRNLLNHICNLLKKTKAWKVTHIFRECNQVADSLAKEGASRDSDLVVIHNGP
ncbi:hypothetical protein PTKIN_Ptkin14bG0188900 [Pterospermum kingtungense]